LKRPSPFRIFQAWIDRGPAPAYLLYGGGAGIAGLLAHEWERVLRADGKSVETFGWTTADLERDSSSIAWRSPSFFASMRIYVLPDLADTKKAGRDAIKSYLATPEPSAILILHGTDFRQAKTFSAAANLLSAAPGEEQALDALAGHAVAVALEARRRLSRVSALFLARWTGGSFEAMTSELGKLLAYSSGKEEISEADIRDVCVFRGDVSPFQLAEALVRKDRPGCLSLLRRFAQNAKDEEYHQLIGAVAWYLRDRIRGKGGGVTPGRAAELFEALSRIDRELKGESRLSPAQLFEIRVLSVLA